MNAAINADQYLFPAGEVLNCSPDTQESRTVRLELKYLSKIKPNIIQAIITVRKAIVCLGLQPQKFWAGSEVMEVDVAIQNACSTQLAPLLVHEKLLEYRVKTKVPESFTRLVNNLVPFSTGLESRFIAFRAGFILW